MTVAVTCELWCMIVANSRVTYGTVNDTRFIVGEVETLRKVNRQGSDDVTSDHKTKRNFTLPTRRCCRCCCTRTVRVEVSFETAWYPSAQNTMHVSPMEAPPQFEFTPTPLCTRVSERSICEHDGETLCASLTKFTRRKATRGSC